MRDIRVSPDVYHRIWACWIEGDETENDILRRVLPRPIGSEGSNPTPGLGRKLTQLAEAAKEEFSSNSIEEPSMRAIGKMRWKDYVFEALQKLGGEADLAQIYRMVGQLRSERGEREIESLEATVRQTLEAHSSDSLNYREGRDDLFRRTARGRWALR